ncbi:MAG TPA: HD-GYP domain-containing protein [Candidatus Baltobacteraceae bacterium]|nr:HD-GYP domain-containing protein [Candidatus Baltobacteraceae bacterium]
MASARTLTALGAALGERIPELARCAVGYVTIPSLTGDSAVEATLGVLLDRLCLSLTLAKPVGLTTWAERESPRIGRAAIVDVASAATHTIAVAATAYDADQRRLLAFLDVLAGEIERAALGGDGEELLDRPGAEATVALLSMLAERDYGTCCHSKATAEWARRLARAMDCDEPATEFIAICGLLHDIGKISTPDHVLLKPSPLSLEEWEVMRDHAASGSRILSQIPALASCAVVVRAHHERFDGTGYPDGLYGTGIPFEARLVAVADAFHAMISERPYREPVAPRHALQILQDGRASQWDPDVVDAMVGMFSRRTTIVSHAHTNVSSA